MNITILSRPQLISARPALAVALDNYGIISIDNTYNPDPIYIAPTSSIVFTRYYAFDDVDVQQEYTEIGVATVTPQGVETVTSNKILLTPINWSQASDIASVILENAHHIDTLIVQCGAGISRSAGVAAGILEGLGEDSEWIWKSNKYRPNMRCYRFVLDAMRGKLLGKYIK